MIAMIPTTFTGIPKPNCHYSSIESLIQHELQHLLVVSVLTSFGTKLPLGLLCMIVNTSSDEIVVPKNRHLGKMKPISKIDDPLKPLVTNESHIQLTPTRLTHDVCSLKTLHTTIMDPPMTQNLYQKPQF